MEWPDLTLEDLAREGPGSLLVILKLLSRGERGEVDLRLLGREILDEGVEGGVSSNSGRPGGGGKAEIRGESFVGCVAGPRYRS